MKIDEKTTIKYFDIIIKELDDISFFSVNNILINKEYLKVETTDEKELFSDITKSVKTFGLYRDFFDKKGENGWLKLTDKGIDLKDSKKGYLEYVKSIKKTPLTLYQKIYLTFFICFGLFGVYKVVQPTVSVSEFDKLKNDFDSLKTEFDSNKKLNSKSTLELSNDTLRTKN